MDFENRNGYFRQFTVIITETFERQTSNVQVNLIHSGVVLRVAHQTLFVRVRILSPLLKKKSWKSSSFSLAFI